jgi:hypothetical protein
MVWRDMRGFVFQLCAWNYGTSTSGRIFGVEMGITSKFGGRTSIQEQCDGGETVLKTVSASGCFYAMPFVV